MSSENNRDKIEYLHERKKNIYTEAQTKKQKKSYFSENTNAGPVPVIVPFFIEENDELKKHIESMLNTYKIMYEASKS